MHTLLWSDRRDRRQKIVQKDAMHEKGQFSHTARPHRAKGGSSKWMGPTHSCHRICMVCDYFYPKLGGVETHIWSLMQNLIKLGHKVILVTHNYNNRVGVRYMTNALKVYYCPDFVFHDGAVFPDFFTFLPLFRNILIRERIEIVHCHQASSIIPPMFASRKRYGIENCLHRPFTFFL